MTSSSVDGCDPELMAHIDQIIEMPQTSLQRRKKIWKTKISNISDSDLNILANDYIFTPAQINHAFKLAGLMCSEYMNIDVLKNACNRVMSRSFGGLTIKTVSDATSLSHFVLPPEQKATFETILRAARAHSYVIHEWGFGHHLTTGKGLCILFDGVPGTGKTFAAEVIASELHRPLQRVDMSNLVSKWVGETGENIVKLFSVARMNHSILLLDEADALLSKRTLQTSKSSDRYANMEINIILQEIERYDGITILTTNLSQSLDEALERRIQYRISFRVPGIVERESLWQMLISPRALVDKDINFYKLASEFELCGGHIKNAILHAAHIAASDNRPITECDLIIAARIECQKLGKLVRNS